MHITFLWMGGGCLRVTHWMHRQFTYLKLTQHSNKSQHLTAQSVACFYVLFAHNTESALSNINALMHLLRHTVRHLIWFQLCVNRRAICFLISQVRDMISVLHSSLSVGVYVLRRPVFPSIYLLSVRCMSFYIHNDLYYTLFLLTVSSPHSSL